jgi:hypothetical protein
MARFRSSEELEQGELKSLEDDVDRLVIRDNDDGTSHFVVAQDDWELFEFQRIVSQAPQFFRNRFTFRRNLYLEHPDQIYAARIQALLDEDRRKATEAAEKKKLQEPFDLGKTMEDVWKHTNQQTSRWMLRDFNDDSMPLSMTSFTGGSWYGMTPANRLACLKLKSNDIDNNIPYFDNEFVQGECRLALEFDLKSMTEVAGWRKKFKADSKRVCSLAAMIFDGKDTICHVLTRYPYQRKKDQVWKYGMHLIFQEAVVSVDEGRQFTDACTQLFPDDDEGYVDGIYQANGTARLRPAFARKFDRASGTGSLYYRYDWSIKDGNIIRRKWSSTFDLLKATSLVYLS